MTGFAERIRPAFEAELAAAARAEAAGEATQAFAHLERAHVLGQASTRLHVRAHWRMLAWGWHQRRARECLGQLLRLLGAATKTAIGLVPEGNTGGTSVSPFRRLPLDPELAARIAEARSGPPPG